MESQAVHHHSHAPGYEQDPNTVGLHSIVEGEDHGEHHHEKKSVLKKVKAKAKKLKDTITKHGHGHSHEGHEPDDHDLDEEDDEDEDEEMVEDPEVHGAPMYASSAVRAAIPYPTNPEKHEGSRDRLRTDYGGVMPMEEGVRAPANTPHATAPPETTSRATDPTKTLIHEAGDRPKVNLTSPGGLEKDLAAPKDREELYRPSNYETKVTDPTGSGGREAKIAPLDQSFGAMHIRDETRTKPTQVSGASTGSHDQFSPEPVKKETEPLLGTGGPVPLRNAPTGGEGGLKDENKPSSPRSYTEKISSATTAATSVVADKAIAAKNILTSKLGYGTGPEGDVKESSGDKLPGQQGGGYTEKISSATHTIADKAALATSLVASKIGYGPKEEQTIHESSGVTEHPVDKPSEQSSYTGKIAAVAGTAKDAVASKLGYGSTEQQKTGGGSAGETASVITHEKKVAGQDKGVSMRDYLAEKLKPGEEDKALSEVISSALNKQKKDINKPVVITESKEVTRHLGEGGRGEVQPNSPTRGVVDYLKGAVGSWLGKSTDPHSSDQQSHGAGSIPSSADTAHDHAGEQRLQESTS